jgi:alkyl hydroperoxide reductase subunit AhpC
MQGPNPTEPVNYTSFSYPSTLKEVILVCTKAVNALTIGNENRLKMQVEVLAASTNETEEIINWLKRIENYNFYGSMTS